MTLRRLLLRIMLISLAVAAALGAGSVLLLPAGDVWRIFGTGILTAAACGILLPISLLTDKPKSRSAGLLGMAIILIEYLLAMSLIWGSEHWGDTLMEQVGFATLFVPTVGVPAVALLRIAGTKLGRWAGRIGVALCGVEFILLMIAARMEATRSNSDQAWSTAGVCAIFFPLLLLSLAGLNASPGAWRRWPAIIMSFVSLVVCLVGIWRDVEDHPSTFAVLVSIATVLAYVNIAMLCPLKSGQIWARWVAVLSVAATAACIDCGVFLNYSGNDELFGRLAAATGIIAGCATLALAIFAALNRKIERPAIMLQDVRSVEVICPLCRKKQPIATGGAMCVECGLRITIQLEQPQCAKCGHILYGLKFDRCPECGTAVGSNEPSVTPLPV
jgi:rRNA maturation protein Nop10